jgi:lipoprotein-anchoring transpeptidase ErfK/SrfK
MLLSGGAPPQEPQATAAAIASEPATEAEAEPQFRRQEVDYAGPEAPGTVVVDTPDKFLFLIEPGGRALRYGVGRPGFTWSGVKRVSRKAEWPDWTPPPDMLLRRPDLPRYMAGGPDNPLGARALYLGSSLYRIHGTNEPSTIGHNVSSGCIRMMNEDVIDLYNRVPVGAKVVVL